MKQDMDWDDYVGQRLSLRQAIAIGSGLGFLVALLILAVAFMLLGGLLAHKAHAQERYCASVGHRWICSREWPHTDCGWRRYCRRHSYRGEDYREGIRHYRAEREDYDRREEQHCRDIRRAVGDQHLTVDGAKKAANDAWSGLIRFHMGEAWMDLLNARQITYMCSRSSIKEGGVTTLGQTLQRCEISAQPCRAPRNEESEKQ